ncbi:MAG: hypothetical protein C4326_11400 [Ignavibacteria bacterium]
MTAPALPSSIPKTKRIEFIDLLRGWAVLVMIETHVMNGTVSAALRSDVAFSWITFINGLVAPSFTFAAGLAYAVATQRKIHDYLAFGKPLLLNLRRLLFVVMIGYLLHIPKFNLHQILYETSERDWQTFFQADVLQCIGVSLLIVQAMLLLLRTEPRLYRVLLVLALVVPFASPIMWGIDWRQHLPLPIAGYMNGMHFPHFPGFPLFPWSAFIFAGAVVGYHYIEAKQKGTEIRYFVKLIVLSGALIVLAHLTEPLAARLYPVYDYGRSSPNFFFLRLGIVLTVCALLFFYERRRAVSPTSIITLVGRESLIVYAVHLFLLYGNFGKFNVVKAVNHSFDYLHVALGTLVLTVLMIALAYVWGKVRVMYPRVKQSLQWGIAAAFTLVFFFGPGE